MRAALFAPLRFLLRGRRLPEGIAGALVLLAALFAWFSFSRIDRFGLSLSGWPVGLIGLAVVLGGPVAWHRLRRIRR